MGASGLKRSFISFGMNIRRRTRIEELLAKLRELAEEERECYDNLPDSIQASERGEEFDQNASQLEEACDLLDEILAR